ncbi:hypothetical protein HN385_06105 [archaeon]|jgi:hypothetical protein|nr:hypothetical protein [archaeon]MBT7192456.1 hypothetical protein [archaeon]
MEKSIEELRKEYEAKRREYGDPGNLKIKGFIPLDKGENYECNTSFENICKRP